MRKRAFVCVLLCVLLCWAAVSQTQPSTATPEASQHYYVSDGKVLLAVTGDPAHANCSNWQFWLYPHSVHLERSGAGLAYVRWGVVQGESSGAIVRQLAVYQQFEEAYAKFFGPSAWGRFTFSYAIGPIALAGARQPDTSSTLLRSRIDYLNRRLEGVVEEVSASLTNGERREVPLLVEAYFQQVRNSVQDLARFYARLARLPAQSNYLDQELALLTPGVSQAENGAAQVTAFLPSVKLPADKNWMSYSETGGSEGTHSVTIAQISSTVWVEQSWTGGNGSMAGTNIITVVPFQEIGSLEAFVSQSALHAGWTVVIHSANPDGFPEKVTSPVRITGTRTYPAVDLKTNDQSVYLEFSNPSEAQDAYAYFLYHKQRGS